jgi:hypothetical protein
MPAPGASSLPSSADRDEDTPVEIEALAWAGPSSVLVLGDDGSAMTLDLADGSVLDAKCLDISEDAQEWPTLLLPSPWEASGETDDAQFALRDGDDALLLPSGARVNADGEIPACAALSKRAFFRALLERVEAFQLSDGARLWWADGIEARAMAASRHLFLLERDDLIVLDGSTGDARARFPGLAEDCDRVEVLDGRSLALLSTREEAPLIRVVDANRGQVLAEAALPCDGVARVGDTIWVWTDDGTLLRLGLAR